MRDIFISREIESQRATTSIVQTRKLLFISQIISRCDDTERQRVALY